MANIEEYLPQVSTPEPVGGVSPNIELAGAMGRAVSHLGENISQVGQTIRERSAQQETADVYADFANQRQYWTSRVQQETQDGSLDVDKISQDYDDQTSDLSQNLSTPQGRNYFERQQARLKGQVLHMATSGAATVAANESAGSWQKAIDTNSAVVQQDPSQLQDLVHQGIETVDSLIQTGGMPEKMRDKAVAQMQSQYTESAIIGQAQNGTKEGPSIAAAMLKDPAFAGALNVQQRDMLDGRIKAAARDHDVEQERTTKAVNDAQTKAAEAWGQDALPKLTQNALSTKDVLGAVQNGTLKWEQGERWINMIKEGTKQEVATDPRTKNALIQRIVNPDSQNPIDATEDLMPYVGKGISVQDFNQLNSLMNKTPEQQQLHQGEKSLFDSARKTIRFKNMMTGQYDLLGEQKLSQFMADYTDAKKAVGTQGGNASDLVNPNSPLYFGKRLENYQTSMEDQLNHQAEDRSNKALGLRPTGNNPNPTPVKGARKPNESASDYLKRIGG